MADAPAPVGANIWQHPTKPEHSMTNIRCWGKFWSHYKAKDKTMRIFQCVVRRSKCHILPPRSPPTRLYRACAD